MIPACRICCLPQVAEKFFCKKSQCIPLCTSLRTYTDSLAEPLQFTEFALTLAVEVVLICIGIWFDKVNEAQTTN